MTLKTIQEYYPIKDTLVGSYGTDQTFTATKYAQVADIDRWDYAPLDWGEGYMPFIRYRNGEFECWYFSYWRVCGYYTEGDYDGFKLVTHSEEFGYEVIDLDKEDKEHVIIIPEYNKRGKRKNAYEDMLEIAARKFDQNAYEEGRILTSYDAVKNFVMRLEENSKE